jgi:hypothetical protein
LAIDFGQEMILADKASVAQATESRAKAEATFKKEERAREGAQAMLEYLASGREARENMAKLKALRLAKEATGETAKEAPKPAKKAAAKVKTPRALKRTQQ